MIKLKLFVILMLLAGCTAVPTSKIDQIKSDNICEYLAKTNAETVESDWVCLQTKHRSCRQSGIKVTATCKEYKISYVRKPYD